MSITLSVSRGLSSAAEVQQKSIAQRPNALAKIQNFKVMGQWPTGIMKARIQLVEMDAQENS